MPACLWCDNNPDGCGTNGAWLRREPSERVRYAPFIPGETLGLMYVDAHMRSLYEQERDLRRAMNRSANELLVPLCAPRELILPNGPYRPHRIFGMQLDVIITSEVKKPTLRYVERH